MSLKDIKLTPLERTVAMGFGLVAWIASFIIIAILVLAPFSAALGAEPSKTYATWSPTDKNSKITLSNANLTATNSSGVSNARGGVRSNIGKTGGKWYWEQTFTYTDDVVGVANETYSLAEYIGNEAGGWAYHRNGNKYHNYDAVLTGYAYGSTWTAGDVLSVAIDADANKVWFAKNGVWQASGNPAAGTGFAFDNVTGTIFGAYGVHDDTGTQSTTANFGATSFAYTPPSGFHAGLYDASCEEGFTLSEDESECVEDEGEEEPPPEEGEGPFVCTEIEDGECTEFAEYVETIYTLEDLGLDGSALGQAFAWGAGIVLVFFGLGLAFGNIHKILKAALGGQVDG